jgi:hypothetical protein
MKELTWTYRQTLFLQPKTRNKKCNQQNQVLVVILCMLNLAAFSNSFAKRQVNAEPLTDETPIIDGLLNDACWQQAQWVCDFVQYTPVENAVPSQKTCFAVFNDDN